MCEKDLEVCLDPVDLSEGGGGGNPLVAARRVCVETLNVSRGVWEWRCVQLNPHLT